MLDKNELTSLVNGAKDKLEQQSQGEDIYAEFREEFEEIAKDNNIEIQDKVINEEQAIQEPVKEERIKLQYEMDDDEYEYTEAIMEEAKIDNDEEIIYPGGPTTSEVNGWKKKFKGCKIFAVRVLDEFFTVRTLNRFEYKQLIRQPNVDASQREEIICETVVLHPYNYIWQRMAKEKAGIPSTLSQIIMQKSGFTDEYYIEEL